MLLVSQLTKAALLLVIQYSTGRRITVEIHQMSSADGAAAIFETKISEGGESVEIGDAASLNDYYLNFRQGNYLVTLIGYSSDAETTAGLTEIARVIFDRITSDYNK